MSARPCVTPNRSQGSWRSLVSVTQGCTWEREKIRRRRGSAEGTRPHRRGGSLGEGGRGPGDKRPLRPLRPGRRVLGVTELKPTSVARPGDAELPHGHCRWGQTDGRRGWLVSLLHLPGSPQCPEDPGPARGRGTRSRRGRLGALPAARHRGTGQAAKRLEVRNRKNDSSSHFKSGKHVTV